MIIQTQYKYFSESHAPTSIFSHFGSYSGVIISVFVNSKQSIFKYLRNYKVKNAKAMSNPAESTDLIFQIPKYNPIPGETVPLKCVFKSLRLRPVV
jgi:hypothetical protein